jgi:hypothetical protein
MPRGPVVISVLFPRTTLGAFICPKYADSMAPVGPQPQITTSVVSHSKSDMMLIDIFQYNLKGYHKPQAVSMRLFILG